MEQSLNPYSNGMEIEYVCSNSSPTAMCLNPYSNGMEIEYAVSENSNATPWVLILILMEWR